VHCDVERVGETVGSLDQLRQPRIRVSWRGCEGDFETAAAALRVRVRKA
jgi:hypothetical protein